MKKMRAAISNSSTIQQCCCGFPGCLKCIEWNQQMKPLTSESSSSRSSCSASDLNSTETKKYYKGLIILAITGISLMFASCMTYILDPQGLAIKIVLTMTDGSFIFRLWQKPPINVYLKVYLFNVTNGDQFLKGEEKLKLQEVGPYIYQEVLEHEHVHFNENGTVTYIPNRHVVPTPELLAETALGRGLNDNLVVPNIPLLGISSKLADYSLLVQMGFSTLVNTVDSKPFENIKVKDYLWGHEDPIVKIANMALSDWITFERLGLLDRMFDTGNDVVTMNKTSFTINRYNGRSMLSEGYVSTSSFGDKKSTPICAESLEGVSEGVLFSRNMPRDPTSVYRKAFCRTLSLQYLRDEPAEDIYGYPGGLRFGIKPETFNATATPEHGCHCAKRYENSPCTLVDGLSDITKCYYGIPAAASFPHFMHGDPSLFNKIEGLNPDPELHSPYIVVQEKLGIPLGGHMRMQTNLVLRKNKFVKRISKFGDMVLPIIWTDLTFSEIPANLAWMLHLCLIVVPPLQYGFIYGAATFGFSCILAAMCGYICRANYSNHNEDLESPITNRRDSSGYHLVHILTPDDLISNKECSGVL